MKFIKYFFSYQKPQMIAGLIIGLYFITRILF
jgi:hypothetical protein